MYKTPLLAAMLALACGSVAAQTTQSEPTRTTSLAELTVRIQSLEANAQALRQQAEEALAAAHEAQAELKKMQADQEQKEVEGRLAAVTRKTPPTQASGIGTGNAFNPAIAVILNGYYAHHSLDDGEFDLSGFPAAGEAGPVPQGFSLGESEISLAANIDDKFYGQLTVTAESEDGHDHVGVEEAFIDTTALPAGFGVRAGRFYSNIGYLNSHHAHTDFFSERPLAYQAFLGNQYGDDGVSVQWVAPVNMFVQLGGEAFRGENYPAAGARHGGIGAHSAYLHLGGDVGTQNAWLAGLSMLRANARDGEDGFSGRDTVWIADATWKWSPHGNFKESGLLLRSEYLRDKRKGHYEADAEPDRVADPLLASMAAPWTGTRSGFYVEGVYNINRTWNTGYRYDRLRASTNAPFDSDFNPWKHSLMLTWQNSEFSLLRLQYSHTKPDANDSDNALILQYQVALGAHGAHKF